VVGERRNGAGLSKESRRRAARAAAAARHAAERMALGKREKRASERERTGKKR
jgi:hypothetical protein